MGGYWNQILYVNLTTRKSEVKKLPSKVAKKFVGGFGVCLRLAYDLIKPNIDPLSPSNFLIMGAGPLTGTRYPAIRFSNVTKQPLTRCISLNNGPNFGRRLKLAGYDYLVIAGRADTPVYLKIFNDKVELFEAKSLWSRNTVETTKKLWKQHGKQHSIITIGQAGEHLVPLAIAFVDINGTLGRGGMGAVMGSKNLKAIMVSGTKKISVADPNGLKTLTKSIVTTLQRELRLGVYGYIPVHHGYTERFSYPGCRLARHRTKVYPPKRFLESAVGGLAWKRALANGRVNHTRAKDPGCILPGCTDIWTIKKGEFKGTCMNIRDVHLPDRMGGLLWDLLIQGADEENWTVEETIRAISLMKEYGVCLHTFGPTMSLAVDLYNRGIITDKDTNGLVLKGDVATAFQLIKLITFKKGIGKILAGGTSKVIQKFGGEQFTQDVKGLTIQKDPRPGGLDPSIFEQLTNPEGGVMAPAHLVVGQQINTYSKMKRVCKTLAVPETTTQHLLTQPAYNLARLTPYDENFFALLNCLDLCVYYHTPLQALDYPLMAKLYTTVTGDDVTSEYLQKAADRIWTLYRAINVREGQTRKDDQPPMQWFKPYTNETGERVYLTTYMDKQRLTPNDLERFLDDYYDERGWEIKRGIPSKEKLTSLGLDFVVKDFKKSGIF